MKTLFVLLCTTGTRSVCGQDQCLPGGRFVCNSMQLSSMVIRPLRHHPASNARLVVSEFRALVCVKPCRLIKLKPQLDKHRTRHGYRVQFSRASPTPDPVGSVSRGHAASSRELFVDSVTVPRSRPVATLDSVGPVVLCTAAVAARCGARQKHVGVQRWSRRQQDEQGRASRVNEGGTDSGSSGQLTSLDVGQDGRVWSRTFVTYFPLATQSKPLGSRICN